VAGVPAEGKAFARSSDLEAAIRGHKVEFAVIDGVYLAERGVPYTVLATATSNGEVAPKWGLFAANATSVKDLQGRKLALAYSGPRDTAFIENALFEGELQVNHFFGGRSTAPDIASAVTAVTLKRADAVFAPERAGKSLKKIFDAGRIPNAAFCQVASGISSEVVAKVRSAVLQHGAEGPGLDGWRAASADAYRSLSARMSARVRRPVMVEPDMVRLENQNVLVAPKMEPGLVDLKNQFWNP
jgi:ABC-type amino acid transport substrate-binding protein